MRPCDVVDAADGNLARRQTSGEPISAGQRRKRALLQVLFREIADWSPDQPIVLRRLEAINVDSALAIVAEAPGPRTLRLSGVSYFGAAGRISQTGAYLDEILRPIGYTVYPPNDLELPHGRIDSTPGTGRCLAYCCDLCPCFPGYEAAKQSESQRIARPSDTLMRSALERRFVARELGIIKPKVVLLLGAVTYRTFSEHLLGTRPKQPLGSLVQALPRVSLPPFNGASVVSFLHPSSGNPSFLRWYFSSNARNREALARCLKYGLEQ